MYDYCTRTRRQALLEEWDVEGNRGTDAVGPFPWQPPEGLVALRGRAPVAGGGLHPDGSGERLPVLRGGSGPWPGFNDLASQEPALAAQWHPERNGPLTPDQVVCGSTRRVWWQCGSGHVWAASVKSRAAGAGCPYCTGRRISPGKMIWPPCIPLWPGNGTPPKMGG